MPGESMLWKGASMSFPRIMNMCRGQMKSWPATLSVWRRHTSGIMSLAYSPDGWTVVSGSFDKTVRIWDAQTGAAVGEPLAGHTSSVFSVAHSPDGQNIISGSSDNTIRIWDAQTGAAVGEPLTGHTDWVRSVAYSPDGQNIISGSDDRSIQTSDLQLSVVQGEPQSLVSWMQFHSCQVVMVMPLILPIFPTSSQ